MTRYNFVVLTYYLYISFIRLKILFGVENLHYVIGWQVTLEGSNEEISMRFEVCKESYVAANGTSSVTRRSTRSYWSSFKFAYDDMCKTITFA